MLSRFIQPLYRTCGKSERAIRLIPAWRGAATSQPLVQVDSARRLLLVDHHVKEDGVYPTVWLRDNCRCPDCYHAPTGQRRLLLRHLDVTPTIQDWRVDGQELHVEWGDQHRSVYSLPWLLQRSFTPDAEKKRQNDPGNPAPKAFGPDFVPEQIDFEAAMGDERRLLRFLHALKRDGLVLLNATPEERGLERLCEALSFVQETQYGVYYDVIAKPDPTNLAYTAETLGLHSDLPYMRQLPGIQVLQCVQQTDDVKGGENLITDCRHVGRILKNKAPEVYRILTTQKVRYWTYGVGHLKDYHLIASHPVLYEGEDGEVAEIVYSDAIRDSLQVMDPMMVEPWYKALRHLHDLMMEEAFVHRMESGQTMVFDNRRLLHGRNGYRMDSGKAERRLRGCYIPWDETESRLRRLAEKFGNPEQ